MANLKTKLSAAMLALIAAGASAPVMMAQFQKEKEGTSLIAYQDQGGKWTICGGVTAVNGKPVYRGMRLTLTQCNAIDKVEQAKALAWVGKNVYVPLSDELFRLRAANLIASENIGRWKTQLEDAEPDQIKFLIEKGRAAETAMMRNTVRIESICRTLDMISMNKALLPKIAADIDYRIVAADKVVAETEKLKGEGGDQQVIVHNALPLPGQ
ncbi:lysozyme [Rahnella perminowiae]|uniref:lysozyme n=1 Tax=Rahnella perminowiae TaxID=2816244 RepID=UPI001EE5F746|nr:hypothetical protein [Rahnella perminowiae]